MKLDTTCLDSAPPFCQKGTAHVTALTLRIVHRNLGPLAKQKGIGGEVDPLKTLTRFTPQDTPIHDTHWPMRNFPVSSRPANTPTSEHELAGDADKARRQKRRA